MTNSLYPGASTLIPANAGLQNLIEAHPFLAGLSQEHRRIFHDCASVRRFASEQVVFHEGAEADHFYLIATGRVTLNTFVPGHGMVSVQDLGPGAALGWSWLFPPYVWHFTASTREPTEVISLDARALRAKAAEDPEFHSELFSRIAESLYQRFLATRAQLLELERGSLVTTGRKIAGSASQIENPSGVTEISPGSGRPLLGINHLS